MVFPFCHCERDVVNTGHAILTIAFTLILVNIRHAILTRDIPAWILPEWDGTLWFDVVFGLPDMSDVVNTGHPILTFILVNISHPILTRDIHVLNFA